MENNPSGLFCLTVLFVKFAKAIALMREKTEERDENQRSVLG